MLSVPTCSSSVPTSPAWGEWPPCSAAEAAAAEAAAAAVVAAPEILKHGKGVEIYTESNPVALCTRPELLVEGSTSN